MTTLAAGVLGGACLLLVAGAAAKVVDPSRTAGALRAVGWPAAPGIVRLGAVAELGLGAAGLVVGGPAVASLVAASYLAFAAFVATALRRGAPIGTCGCLGSADTPPSPAHVVVDAALAAGVLLSAAGGGTSLLDAPSASAVLAVAVAAGAYTVLVGRAPAFWQR